MSVREDARANAEFLEELEECGPDNTFLRVWVDVGGELKTFEIDNVENVEWLDGRLNVFLEDDGDEWEGLDERRGYYHFDRDRVIAIKFIDTSEADENGR